MTKNMKKASTIVIVQMSMQQRKAWKFS